MVTFGIEGILLVTARLLFGGVIAFTGLNHFLQLDQMVGYADYKGLPAPKASVVASGAVLLFGGLGIILGVLPFVSALAIAGFLIIAAVTMHDFWAVEEDQKQDEMNAFLKNIAMAGGALAIAALTTQTWILSLGIGI